MRRASRSRKAGAHAVSYVVEGRTERAEAASEIILCGGAVNSPQLLMLSGIGPAAHLSALGIPVVADIAGVGENLQDHPMVSVCYVSSQPVSLANANHATSIARYLLTHDGPLASNVAECGGFVRTRPGVGRPDLQFHFAPGYYLDHGFRTIDGHGFTFGPTLTRPESRGRIRLRTGDPFDPPLIDPNYLGRDADRLTMLEGIRIARRIAAQRAFEPFRRGGGLSRRAVYNRRGTRRIPAQHGGNAISSDRHVQDGRRTSWRLSIRSCGCAASTVCV